MAFKFITSGTCSLLFYACALIDFSIFDIYFYDLEIKSYSVLHYGEGLLFKRWRYFFFVTLPVEFNLILFNITVISLLIMYKNRKSLAQTL